MTETLLGHRPASTRVEKAPSAPIGTARPSTETPAPWAVLPRTWASPARKPADTDTLKPGGAPTTRPTRHAAR